MKQMDMVALRVVKERTFLSDSKINSPEDAVSILGRYISQFDKEVFAAIYCDTKGKPLCCSILSVGTICGAYASPREVLKMAYLSNAYSVLVMHNHPSGECVPSAKDYDVTRAMKEACKTLDFKFLDHIIVGNEMSNTFYSFESEEELPMPNIELEYDLNLIKIYHDKGVEHMMSPEECFNGWNSVMRIYDETRELNNPKITIDKIVAELGLENTYTVFSTVAKDKEHDGRIYGKNRELMNSIPYVKECIERSYGNYNRFMLRDLDHIHTSHINNLITELSKIKTKEDKVMNYNVTCNALENGETMKNGSKLVGLASVVIDDKFAVNSIRVVERTDGKYGVMFPSRPSSKEESGFKDMCFPTTTEMYHKIYNAIIDSLEQGGAKISVESESKDYKVSAHVFTKDSLKGIASIDFGGFVCNDITIRQGGKDDQGKDKPDFVAMPSYKTKEGDYKNVCYHSRSKERV